MWLIAGIFAADAVNGLVNGDNMYTLKPGGAAGIAVNTATLLAIITYTGWRYVRAGRRRAWEDRLVNDYASVLDEYERKTAAWPYDALGLQQGASPKEIKRAHRSLVKRFHPDHNPGDEQAHESFLVVQQAYEALGSP